MFCAILDSALNEYGQFNITFRKNIFDFATFINHENSDYLGYLLTLYLVNFLVSQNMDYFL